MAATTPMPGAFERRLLKAEVTGDVLFDRFSRGRYATDASHYQMMPLGVVVPRTIAEAERALALARAEGVQRAAARRRHLAVRPDGQRIAGRRLLEASEQDLELDVGDRRCVVEPASCSTSSTARSSRTGCGFRSTSRPPRARPSAAWRPTIPAAAARCATARCATTCSRSTPCSPTARKAHFGPVAPDLSDLPAELAAAPARARPARHRRARGRRDRGALPEGAAPRRRLQSRCARAAAATTSTSRTSWSARRARSPSPPASS